MNVKNQKFIDFFELINTYPSPHNGQPVRLKQISDNQFEVYFQKERGLQSADISFIFSFVSMGVFVEHVTTVAQALGHHLTHRLNLPLENDLHGTGLAKFADLSIEWNAEEPNPLLLKALQFRQTSRKKYYEPLPGKLVEDIIEIAQNNAMTLTKLSSQQAKHTIWLNQRAVFDDMFDPPVRQELDHWLRYSQEEKELKRDGLAYDCMELNGPLMKYIIHHPGWLRAPILSSIIKQYYLRTMTDKSDVFYMMAPFQTEAQSFAIGAVIARIWIALSLQGYYLHPFGTIVSNDAAHQDFLKLVQTDTESRNNYLVFIFRAGKSATPVRSLRLEYDKHLIME